MLILADGKRIRSARLSPAVVATSAAFAVFLGIWFVTATAYVLFHDDVQEAAHAHLSDKQRAYEDDIASLRRQIDEINGRQFLDQTTVERKLEELRKRQASLEERQMGIASLIEGVRTRDVTLRIEGPVQAARSAFEASPLLTARPRPDSGSLMAGLRASSDPAGRAIEAIDASMDSLTRAQTATLAAIEQSVDTTIETLASISDAIDVPIPESVEHGVGGPLIELRGLEATPLPDPDRITRLRTSLDHLDTLKAHVRHLPVRLPLDGNHPVTSSYGTRMDPFLGRPALHTGIDFRASRGTPVKAVAAGTVVSAGRSGGYGNLVEIDHGNGYATRYAHLAEISVNSGDTVAPSDIVGKVGTTGRTTGPHLHYETRRNGRARNPAAYVEAAKLVPAGF